VDWAYNCELFSTLFGAGMICVIMGNVVGMLAWEERREEQSVWKWLLDPTCAFRASYYKTPASPARYAAMTFLGSGGVFLWLLGLALFDAIRSGAGPFCGLAF
jgi:hypothetical protein